jgi:hypothetical protein
MLDLMSHMGVKRFQKLADSANERLQDRVYDRMPP